MVPLFLIKIIVGKGLKHCSVRSLNSLPLPPLHLDSVAEAKKEIFVKTLAFFCTLVEKGCAFDLRKDGEDIDSIGLTDDDPESELESDESGSETSTRIFKDSRRKKPLASFCKGKLDMRLDEYGRSSVQYVRFLLNFITVLMSSHRCEHRKKTDKAHLILRTLD